MEGFWTSCRGITGFVQLSTASTRRGCGRSARCALGRRAGSCRRRSLRVRCAEEDAGDASFDAGEEARNLVTTEEDRRKLWAEIEALQAYLQRLVQRERYTEAADVRDEIDKLKSRDPYEVLQREMQAAVEAERYLDAAKLRDELKLLSPPPRSSSSAEQGGASFPPSNPPSTVEGVSQGIRIAAASFLVEEASIPESNMFVFGYKVRITNELSRTVQLVRRRWKIRRESGAETEVKGAGVIGKQPVLEPRESFAYTSMCPLQSSEGRVSGKVLGSMRGSYDFVTGDTGTESFTAEVNEFFHILP
mmetsp:Transcript_11407/g.34892  ORF Transcript_11407/g.34892 Transcript_11407/m.34892 type:complete len:305 (-) Transcript_11407:251-1165(-)